jgi:hypothetical protein
MEVNTFAFGALFCATATACSGMFNGNDHGSRVKSTPPPPADKPKDKLRDSAPSQSIQSKEGKTPK